MQRLAIIRGDCWSKEQSIMIELKPLCRHLCGCPLLMLKQCAKTERMTEMWRVFVSSGDK